MKRYLLVFLLWLLSTVAGAQNCLFAPVDNGNGLYTFNPDPITLGMGYRHTWDFGDGTNSVDPIPVHLFTAGTFNVCHEVFDSTGQQLCIYCGPLSVAPTPCSFTAQQDWIQPQTINFELLNASSGQVATWDFGDGTSGYGLIAQHTYTDSGTYTPCVSLYDSLTGVLICNSCQTIQVFPSPVTCGFMWYPDLTDPLTLHFVTNPPPGTHVEWDFGNGMVGSGPMVAQSYFPAGSYLVCVQYTDSVTGAQTCTACMPVSVVPVTSSCSYSAIQDPFTSGAFQFFATADSGSTIQWDFGDGMQDSGSQVNHVFPFAGQFNVCMTAVNPMGTVCTYCDTIVVQQTGGGCSYTYLVDSANTFNYTFAYSTTAPATTVHWDFGDGTTDTGAIVLHTFPASGFYNVCAVEADSLSLPVCQACMLIPVVSNSATCNISFFQDSLNDALVYFTCNVSSPTSIVTWNFGDGSTGSGALATHVYLAPGTYTVTVSEIDSATGLPLCSSTTAVTVIGTGFRCTFVADPDPLQPNQIQFTGIPSSLISVLNWDFGDGATGFGNPVNHTYAAPGAYTVCMNETDLQGHVLCSWCMTVSVTIGPFPACNAFYTSSTLGLDAYFIDLSAGTSPATNYLWDFGDGTTSTTRFPQHTYPAPGLYNACLTITDTACSSQFCSQIRVDTAIVFPTTCQAYYVILQMAPYQVAVVNLSSGVNLGFNWDFGDGTFSTDPYPSHLYNAVGDYPLCLTVTEPGTGCTSTYCDTLSVDSLGNVFRGMSGFMLNIMSPASLTAVPDLTASPSFAVYPNPFNAACTLQRAASAKGEAVVRVLDLRGAVLFMERFSTGEVRVPADQWSPGIYLIELTEGDGYRSFRKVIKE